MTTRESALGSVRLIAADIKLAHSVFALPFALLAAFMAAERLFETSEGAFWPGSDLIRQIGSRLILIILAMILARTVAMLSNRLLDRHIDKVNPRTANRAIPSGRISIRAALLAACLCTVAFLAVCAGFALLFDNWWPLILGPFVLAWISAYPLFKRFTALSHLYLGSSLAMSPLAAAIAVDPASLAHQPSLWLLSGMVLCWVAGFDILYALQDVAIDRAQGLYSAPSRYGVPRALWISRLLHGIALACLVASIWVDPRLGVIFAIGVIIVCGLLIYEHLTVARWGTTRIALAFFTLNGIISCLLGALGIADVLMQTAR
jgi:4-hydroxybenzoate polyprenyltransferase